MSVPPKGGKMCTQHQHNPAHRLQVPVTIPNTCAKLNTGLPQRVSRWSVSPEPHDCNQSYKLPIWSQCGTGLTGQMHDDLSRIQDVSNECNFPHADCSWHFSPTMNVFIFNILLGIHQLFVLFLCFSSCAIHGGHFSGFSRGILLVTFWLTEAAREMSNPEPSIH